MACSRPLSLEEENALLKKILMSPRPLVKLTRIGSPEDAAILPNGHSESFSNAGNEADDHDGCGVEVTLQTNGIEQNIPRQTRATSRRSRVSSSDSSDGEVEVFCPPKRSRASVVANGDSVECGPTCDLCGQQYSRIVMLPNPDGSAEVIDDAVEAQGLIDLMASEGLDSLEAVDAGGCLVQLENFAIYDVKRHLVPIDSLCGGDKTLFFSGRIKAYSRWESEGIVVQDVGPIINWWLERESGADSTALGISTDAAHYYFGSACVEYAPLLEPLEEKSNLVYDIVDFLQNNLGASLAEAIVHLEQDRPDAEELVYKHAEFILDQIAAIDEENEDDFGSTSVVDALEKYVAGHERGRTRRRRGAGRKALSSENSMSTTTPLVRSAFENLFPNQIHGASPRDSEERAEVIETRAVRWPPKTEPLDRIVAWNGPVLKNLDGQRYFASCTIRFPEDSFAVEVGDFVSLLVRNSPRGTPKFVILKVHELYEEDGKQWFHGIRFLQGIETILGEALNPMELFVSRDCGTFLLSDVEKKVPVTFDTAPEEWRLEGGKPFSKCRTTEYTYRFRVETGECRFEAVESFNCDVVPPGKLPECENCEWLNALESDIVIHTVSHEGAVLEVRFHGVTYKVGDFVMLDPRNLEDHWIKHAKKPPSDDYYEAKDPKVYPEMCRKLDGHQAKPRGTYEGLVAPLRIGRIRSFLKDSVSEGSRCPNLRAELQMLARVDEIEWREQPIRAKQLPHAVVLTDTLAKRKVADFVGTSKVIREEMLDGKSVAHWKAQNGFILQGEAPANVEKQCRRFAAEIMPVVEPLKCMDLFAGVGGLSIGLDQSGVSKTKWAVEFNHAAAQSFKLNHPEATVYEGDINKILKVMLDAEKNPNRERKWKGVDLPRPGEVDMITGGPPCQGFSNMNMFNYRENAQFRNSLVATYLSCVEYLRPRYVIMENVKNFVSYNKGVVLKFLLKSLVEMGYQCCVGILQAGHFGVPQSRLRAIVIAAAPGETLPRYPKFLTTFSDKMTNFTIDGITYSAQNAWGWSNSAPFRAVTIGDAISDLPPIAAEERKESQPYKSKPVSAFQMEVRSGSTEVRDHFTRPLMPLSQFRVTKIPKYPGADWRDLPNVEVEIDGVIYPPLDYQWFGKKLGVCICAPKAGKGYRCPKEVAETYKQPGTVIPWFMAHSASSNNQWAGSYGRLLKDGYFPTTLASIGPNGKAGTCIHYEQDRILTVREWARSQGFPDSVHFHGRIVDRYRQIGNAVPPPLARAIGFQIRLALLERERV